MFVKALITNAFEKRLIPNFIETAFCQADYSMGCQNTEDRLQQLNALLSSCCVSFNRVFNTIGLQDGERESVRESLRTTLPHLLQCRMPEELLSPYYAFPLLIFWCDAGWTRSHICCNVQSAYHSSELQWQDYYRFGAIKRVVETILYLLKFF